MKKASILLVLFIPLLALCAAPARAQVVNPTTVEFTPSADHSAVGTDSQALVSRYDLMIYLAGASSPMTTASLGKPTPEADGQIRVSLASLSIGWPLVDGSYVARVAAVGPSGSASSDPSNSFVLQNCTLTLGSSSASVAAAGGTGAVTVSAGTSCSWTAASDASWVTLGATAGTGSGSLAYTVGANLTTSARTATLTIGGQTFTLTQGAASCTYSLSATSQSFTSAAGSGSVTLTCLSGCAWTASSNSSWLTVATSSGSGSASITYSVARNDTTTPRTGALTIAGVTYTVTQAAASCSYSLSATSQSIGWSGGSLSVALTCASGCTWTASSGAAWLTIATTSGSGSASIAYTVAKNDTTGVRTGTLTIAGLTYTVTQAAPKRPTAPKKVRVSAAG